MTWLVKAVFDSFVLMYTHAHACVSYPTGPRGVIRSLQAANAVTTLVREQVLQGQLDPPQTVLRKLFEKLGATYIKLGQVRRCAVSSRQLQSGFDI